MLATGWIAFGFGLITTLIASYLGLVIIAIGVMINDIKNETKKTLNTPSQDLTVPFIDSNSVVITIQPTTQTYLSPFSSFSEPLDSSSLDNSRLERYNATFDHPLSGSRLSDSRLDNTVYYSM